MSHLDKFIQNKVRTLLTEQKANLIPIPGNSIEKYDKTNRHVVSTYNQYLSNVNPATYSLTPWPGDKPGIWKNLAAQRFLQSFPDRGNAAPIMPIGYTEFDKVAPKAPEYIWNFGTDTYVISDAGKFYSPTSKITLYWKWLPKGAVKVVKLPTDPIGQVEQLGKRGTGAMELRAGVSPSSPIIGWLYLEANGEPNIEYFQSGIEQDAKNYARNKEERLLDALQVVGFFPGYGEVADLVSAAIHFNRAISADGTVWDWFEGILSLLAMFPVYGSIVKVFIKKLATPLRRIAGNRKIKNIKQALDELAKLDTSPFSEAEQKAFKEFMQAATDNITSIRTKFGPKLKKAGFDDVNDALESLERFLYETEGHYNAYLTRVGSRVANAVSKEEASSISYITKALYKYNLREHSLGDAKQAGEVVGEALSKSNLVNIVRSTPTILKNVFTKLWYFPDWFKVMKANQAVLVENIKIAFTKNMQADPDGFIVFLLYANKRKGIEFNSTFKGLIIPQNLTKIPQSMLNQFKQKVKFIEVPVSSTAKYADGSYNLTGPKILDTEKKYINANTSIDDINKWLSTKVKHGGKDYTSTYKLDETSLVQDFKAWTDQAIKDGTYAGHVKTLVNAGVKEGNPLWEYIVTDPLNHANAIFSQYTSTYAKAIKANLMNYRKYLDVFYEGVHEFLQDVGVAEDDKIKTSWSYDLIKETINLGADTKQTIKNVSAQTATWLHIIKKVGNVETNATPNHQFQSVDPDSTWRPASSYPKAVSGTTALTMPKLYKGGQGKANWYKKTQPVIKQGRA